MKKLLILLFLTPLFSFAQKSRAYFNVSAEAVNLSDRNTSFGGSIGIGGKGKFVDVGAGVLLTQLKGTNSPYIPAFIDVNIHSNKKIARPFVDLEAGWAFYRNEIYNGPAEVGGLFLRPGAGVWVPFGKMAFFIKAAYLRSGFSIKNSQGQKLESYTQNGWTASVGLSF
jgi:hypothetical protein